MLTLLKARSVYRGQVLDQDVERSKIFVYAAIANAVISTTVTALWSSGGLYLSTLTPLALLGDALLARRRDAFLNAGDTPVAVALHILGGIEELPANYVARVEKAGSGETPDPFHAPSQGSAEESLHLRELVTHYQRWYGELRLSETEAEVYGALYREGYAGSLRDLVETARNLTR